MKKTTIYITGLPGFKSAIKTSPGKKWMNNAQDLNEELVRVELPHAVTPERFKQLIGDESSSGYNIMFFYDLHDNSLPTAQTVIASFWKLIERVLKVRFERRWRHSMDLLLNKF